MAWRADKAKTSDCGLSGKHSLSELVLSHRNARCRNWAGYDMLGASSMTAGRCAGRGTANIRASKVLRGNGLVALYRPSSRACCGPLAV